MSSGAVFLGLDNFYYTAMTLGLPTNKRISVNQIDKAAHKFCKQNWRAVHTTYLQSGSSQQKDIYALKVWCMFFKQTAQDQSKQMEFVEHPVMSVLSHPTAQGGAANVV